MIFVSEKKPPLSVKADLYVVADSCVKVLMFDLSGIFRPRCCYSIFVRLYDIRRNGIRFFSNDWFFLLTNGLDRALFCWR